jgi:threonine synthase
MPIIFNFSGTKRHTYNNIRPGEEDLLARTVSRPTLAFKDIGLQFLGDLLEFFLERRNQARSKAGQDPEHLTVIGATSGDTGSAGIYGLRGKMNISVFIMFPTGRISSVQEAQMTTVPDANGWFP